MENLANNYTTTLAASITSTDTTLTVASATGAPSPNFRILIDNEYLLVTAVSGTTFTVTRAIEGTTAAAHSSAAIIAQIITVAGLLQYITDHHTKVNTYYGDFTADIDASTITFDFSLTNKHTVTLGGNRIINFSNMTNGQVGFIELVQDSTGSRTVTFTPTIRWAGGTAPTLTTTAAKADLITIIKRNDGTYAGGVSLANY